MKMQTMGRSHGLKLLFVCFLVLVMAIPAMFISFVSYERSNRADDVTREVASRYGGSQYLTGPFIVVPYTNTQNTSSKIVNVGWFVIYPDTGTVKVDGVETTIRKRSLFKVPTYQTEVNMTSEFGAIDKMADRRGYTLLWDQAEIRIGISDSRGLLKDVYLDVNGDEKTLQFEPASKLQSANISTGSEVSELYTINRLGGFQTSMSLTFLSVPARDILMKDEAFDLSVRIKLGGASRLGVMPYAKSTSFSMVSDWPTPGFEGGFAPVEYDITDEGFSASWSVPYLARGIPKEGAVQGSKLFDIQDKAMVVHFVSEVSPYQTVNRALKYAVMFIGLVFVAFFLFESFVGSPVHPAQYILIGLVQCIFYLLLLAFSEQVGFNMAFILAALATIILTSLYAGAVFKSRQYAWRAALIFTVTYGLLYSLLRMEDMALLVGAVASFVTIALIMYITRNMDWYGIGSDKTAN